MNIKKKSINVITVEKDLELSLFFLEFKQLFFINSWKKGKNLAGTIDRFCKIPFYLNNT